MTKYITKSLYLDYLECPKNAWLKLYKKKELSEYFQLSEHEQHLGEQGMLVEKEAQKLFPEGVSLNQFGIDAFQDTLSHIQNKAATLFQPSFIYDCFYARSDILEYDGKSGQWNLYEIKSTSGVKENAKEIDHIANAAFQVQVMHCLGIKIGKIFIIHLNKEYVLEDALVIKDLFTIEDKTEEVQVRIPKTKEEMEFAKIDLMEKKEDGIICACIDKGQNAFCNTFHYTYSSMPDYSVHYISRIGIKKLKMLRENGIVDIKDIPDEFPLSDKQTIQVKAARQDEIFIDRNAIKAELDNFKYPLYFLDYEALAPAIPRYKGYKPYGKITFQLSLHVVHDEYSEPVHYEYLHEQDTDPSVFIINELQKNIGPLGSVIVWYKPFENDRNKELGERCPEMKQFFDDVINRTYDLMEIFSKQLYVHPGFKGSASIKKVLPALSSNLSHANLDIQEGMKAAVDWYKMVTGNLNSQEKEKIKANLREYCKLDTYAMYVIWKHLMNIIDEFPQKHDLYSYKDISY